MRKYGNMGFSYRILAEASGVNPNTIMRYVRLLEPILKEMENDITYIIKYLLEINKHL